MPDARLEKRINGAIDAIIERDVERTFATLPDKKKEREALYHRVQLMRDLKLELLNTLAEVDQDAAA